MIESALPDEPTPKPLRTTPLTAWHRRLGARMVEYAGYTMPVLYDPPGEIAARCRGGVIAEHLYCRSQAALFDVSHMGQAVLSGPTAAALLERMVPSEVLGLRPGRQRYTVLTNEAGGIVDDLLISNLGSERLLLVVNASRKDHDFAHISAHLPAGLKLERDEDRALIALQGPAAGAVMQRLMPEAVQLPFMAIRETRISGVPCLVSRSGYTGEDGFEVSLPGDHAEAFADVLLEQSEVAPAGLGARDSLRLEAGLCLYGSDIDELTSPVEAGLAWVIGKRRRAAWDFPGAAVIRDQLEHGFTRLRSGIRPEGRAPARALTDIVAEDGTAAGVVTSGGFSPTLNAPIAMGYVRRDLAAPGAPIHVVVRGKPLPAAVVPLPFVPHRYAS